MNISMKHELKNKYTRWIDKAYSDKLLEGATTKSEGGQIMFVVKPAQMWAANDVLIRMMYGLSEAELKELDMSDYKEMLSEAKIVAWKDNKDPL